MGSMGDGMVVSDDKASVVVPVAVPVVKHKQQKLKVPKIIPKREHYQRLSYLYQTGTLISNKQSTSTSTSTKPFDILSRCYFKHLDLVSKKTVLKLSPNLKRTICKNCSRLRTSGLNNTIRIKNESKLNKPQCDIVESVCCCGSTKRYPVGTNLNYIPFSDRDDIVFESNK